MQRIAAIAEGKNESHTEKVGRLQSVSDVYTAGAASAVWVPVFFHPRQNSRCSPNAAVPEEARNNSLATAGEDFLRGCEISPDSPEAEVALDLRRKLAQAASAWCHKITAEEIAPDMTCGELVLGWSSYMYWHDGLESIGCEVLKKNGNPLLDLHKIKIELENAYINAEVVKMEDSEAKK